MMCHMFKCNLYIFSIFTKKGTCYTDTECEELNGIASGSCADGYGICCVCMCDL